MDTMKVLAADGISPKGIELLQKEFEVVVKDKAALDAYQNDPYHCGTVKPYMHKVRSGSVSADYEF